MGESFPPWQSVAEDERISLHPPQLSFCPGYLALPAVPLPIVLPWISSRVFGVCGLPSCSHVVRLERSSFVCGTHAALASARATCANFHSQGQVVACPWVPSCLPYDSSLFLPYHRAHVSVSSDFLAGVGFLSNPSLKGIRVVPCSPDRPQTRAFLRVIPFR